MSALLPLAPDWSSGLTEEHQFRTEVFTSRDGTEQRRALRTTPRRSFRFTAMADGDRLRSFSGLMLSSQGGLMALADYVRGVRTTSALAAASDTLTVPSVPAWLVTGADVALVHGRTVTRFEVESVADLTVTFAAVAEAGIPQGALLAPLTEGWIADSVEVSLRTNTIGTLPVAFDVAPATESVDEGEIDYANWYEDREILTAVPNWTITPSVTFAQSPQVVDYGRGRVARSLPVDFGTRITQGTYLGRDAAEVVSIRQFFARQKGQRGEFLHPTWTHDLQPMEAIVAGDITFTVAGRDTFDHYAYDPVHQTIMLETRSGLRVMRSLAGITLDESGNSVVELTETMGAGVEISDLRRISWAPVVRFASDTLTLEYVTDSLAQVVLSTRSLRPGAPGGGAPPGLDGAARYMLSTYGFFFTDSVLAGPLDLAVNYRWFEISLGVNPLAAQLQHAVNDRLFETLEV